MSQVLEELEDNGQVTIESIKAIDTKILLFISMNLSLYEIILSRTDNSRRRLISGHAAACNIRFNVAPTEYPVVHNSFSSFCIAQISFLVYFSSDTILPYTSSVVNRHFPQ